MTSKEEYALLDKLGICHECKKAKQFPGRKYCPACLERIAARNAATYYSEKGAEYRETRNARNKERYRERKENGICVKCGKKPAKYGLYCYECSIKVKREQAKKNERRRQDNSPFALRDWKKEHRVCYWCGNPIELGNMTSYCDACRQKLSKQAAKNLADKPLKQWKFGGALLSGGLEKLKEDDHD